MPVSRRRLLRVGAALSLAGLAALLPGTAVEADSLGPPLPDSVAQALLMLADLGFDDVVGVYRTLLPSCTVPYFRASRFNHQTFLPLAVSLNGGRLALQ